MNEIRSYKIELKTRDRINLYQSGALNWNQLFTEEPFYIQQNEIQWLFDIKYNKTQFMCAFERDRKLHNLPLDKDLYSYIVKENELLFQTKTIAPWKIFKYQKSTMIFMFSSIMLASLLPAFIDTSILKSVFLSPTCETQCAGMMSTASFFLLMTISFLAGAPIFYLILRRLFLSKFKLQPGRPVAELIALVLLAAAFIPSTYSFYSNPIIVRTISHWKSGTLNKETIAKIKSDFKLERTAAAEDSVDAE